jgi:hypothetical protein
MIMGDAEYVTEPICKERRGSCHELRESECGSRDAWIGKLEKKIDWIFVFAISNLVALVLFLMSIVLTKK